MKTLEQAILKLPEIDKRWETKTITNGNTHKKYCFASFGIPGKKYIMVTERGNYIETYHAAALTLGYEIWWEYGRKSKEYFPQVLIKAIDKFIIIDLSRGFKTITKAISAAFIAAVNDAWEQKKLNEK